MGQNKPDPRFFTKETLNPEEVKIVPHRLREREGSPSSLGELPTPLSLSWCQSKASDGACWVRRAGGTSAPGVGGGRRVVAKHHGSAFNKRSLPIFYDLGDRFITLRIGNFSGTRALLRKGPIVVHRTPSDWMN